MEERIKKQVEAETIPPNIKALFDRLQDNINRSRDIMGKEYQRWRRNLSVYRGEMPRNENDLEAEEVGEPERFVVPMSFAQVQTFVAFCFLLMQQNRRFYEFEQVGDEDRDIMEIGEELLHGEMQENHWPSKFYQSLLDAARMGITVTKEVWTRSTVWVPGQSEIQNINGSNLFDLLTAGDREVVRYEGNMINNISPFKFFPDTALPLTRWREGLWVADEEEYKIHYIKQLERKGLLAGTKHIKRMHTDAWDRRMKNNALSMLYDEQYNSRNMSEDDDFVVVLAEHYVRLVPKEFEIGPEDYEILHLVRIANDQRIVSIERYGYVHDDFPHNVGLLSPDTCTTLSASLCDTIHSIQEVVTYLINARVMGLRKNLGRNLIVDPSVIDMASIANGDDIITTMQGAPKNGIERYVKQLEFRDNTSTNMSEADNMQRLLLMVTGVNENAMGQFSPGRRSATENRAANSGAASRMRMIATLLWTDCYAPQGRKMLCNLRYGLSFEMFQKYLGERPNIEELYDKFVPQDVTKLIGARDVFTFESTMPSEKGFLAQSMQELLIAIIQNPTTAQMYDADKLMEEIYALRGIQTRRFRLPTPALPAVGAAGVGPQGAPVAAPVPGSPPPVV
jgi:hypothetical protein